MPKVLALGDIRLPEPIDHRTGAGDRELMGVYAEYPRRAGSVALVAFGLEHQSVQDAVMHHHAPRPHVGLEVSAHSPLHPFMD